MRPGEVNGVTGYFMTDDELDDLKRQGKIAYDLPLFGARYAYLKEEVLSSDPYVFEMHYTMLRDWQNLVPDLVTIYLLPKDVHEAIDHVKQRHLPAEVERGRIAELEEHYQKFMSSPELENKFDYIVYNNYDAASSEKIIHLVSDILQKQ